MAEKYTEQQLVEMGVGIIRSLKGKGLRIRDIKAILNHATIAIDYIVYGTENNAENAK